MASSGNATRSALARRASRSHPFIRRTFPATSPTVGFIWTMAIRKIRIATFPHPSLPRHGGRLGRGQKKKTPSLHRWSRGRHCPLTSASVNDVETSLSPINWAKSYNRVKEPVKCFLSLVAPQSRGGKAPQVRPDSFPHGRSEEHTSELQSLRHL